MERAACIITILMSAIVVGSSYWGQTTGAFFGYLISSILYGYLALKVVRTSPTTVSAVSVVLSCGFAQLLLLSADPLLSEDIWRYIWDGQQVRAGLNPYCVSPDDPSMTAFEHTRSLSSIRAQIGHAHLVSIYPPLAQFVFAASTWLGKSTIPIRLLMITANMVTLFVVSRWLGCKNMRVNHSIILLSANPVFLFEGAISGHIDSVGVMCFVVSLYFLSVRKDTLGTLFYGFAILTKIVPIFGIPLTFKRKLGSYLTLGLVLLGGYAIWLDDECNALGSLSTFAAQWQHNGSIYEIAYQMFHALSAMSAYTLPVPEFLKMWTTGASEMLDVHQRAQLQTKLFCGAGLVGGLLKMRQCEIWLGAFGALALLLLLSPVVHPWYLMWLVPCLPLLQVKYGHMGTSPLIWWSSTICVAYWARVQLVTTGEWQPSVSLQWVEYLCLYALIFWSAFVISRRRPSNP